MVKALLEKHARAIALRKMGWSYPAIKQELQVNKASLSLWLHKYPLSERQIRELSPFSREKRIEHFRETFRRKREVRNQRTYESEKIRVLPLTDRELYLAGLMLYWGEGLKATTCSVAFSNTNPRMILFAMNWFIRACGVPKHTLRVRFHLYSDMNIDQEHEYWSKLLDLPLAQFRKPYIKQSLRSSITEKGGFGHGTCDLMVYNTALKEKIVMGIKVISDSCS